MNDQAEILDGLSEAFADMIDAADLPTALRDMGECVATSWLGVRDNPPEDRARIRAEAMLMTMLALVAGWTLHQARREIDLLDLKDL